MISIIAFMVNGLHKGLVSQVGENGRVSFISACKQVMRFVCLGDDLAPSARLESRLSVE